MLGRWEEPQLLGPKHDAARVSKRPELRLPRLIPTGAEQERLVASLAPQFKFPISTEIWKLQ